MALISSRTLTNSELTLPYMINADNPSLDYSRYVNTVPTKTDVMNQPTKLEFSCVPFDDAFVKLTRGNYISFQTLKYGAWFTGFVINDPELTLIGSKNGQAVYGYSYVAMSDEYLINLKPLGIINPFFNTTQGGILKALIEDLCPGMYDLTNINDGILQPRYQVKPTDKFTDIVKAFCDAAEYTFYANSGKIYFVPISRVSFSQFIDGNDKHFTPSQLKLTPTSDPIINDATVLGGVEPQGKVTEYFAGDGFTGGFNLVYSPYGIDSTVLLNDDFSGTSLDSSLWTLYDDAASFISIENGYVNVIGGAADSTFDVHIDSAFPIPVEGQLKLTHGEWDFLNLGLGSSNGVLGIICALWTQEPNPELTGCMYGISVEKVSGVQVMYPIINGVKDTTQTLNVDTTNRFVIRTIVSSNVPFRSIIEGAYTNAEGQVISVPPITSPAEYTFTTLLSIVNITTGVLMSQTTFVNSYNATSDDVNYALYIPVTSNDLHATFGNITLDYPIQGSLYHAHPPESSSAVMGTQTDTIYGTKWPKVYSPTVQSLGQNELDALDGMAPTATIADTITGSNVKSSLLGTPQYNIASAALTYFKDSVALVATTPTEGTLISLEYNAAGTATGRISNQASINTEASTWKDDGIRAIVKTDCSPKPRTSAECEVAATVLVGGNCFQHYEGTYQFPSDFVTYNREPISGLNLKFRNLPSSFPLVKAEQVTQVVTTFDARRPIERFTHTASFGQIDRVAQLLAKYNTPTDVFAPTDSLEMPITVDSSQVGLVFTDEVNSFVFNGMDVNNYYYSITGNPPYPFGGYEIRLSDDSWGSSISKNFVTRLLYGTEGESSDYEFSLPRNSRSKIVFARAFDARNRVLYSEDLTQSPWTKTNFNVVNGMTPNPDDDYSLISNVTTVGNGGFSNTEPSLSNSDPFPTHGISGNFESLNDTTTGSNSVCVAGNTLTLSGWAASGDLPYAPLNVKVYVDGVEIIPISTSSSNRSDVAGFFSNPAFLPSGFSITVDSSRLTNGTHIFKVIGFDSVGNINILGATQSIDITGSTATVPFTTYVGIYSITANPLYDTTDTTTLTPLTFTVDVKVPENKKIRLAITDGTSSQTLDVTGVAAWQRVSVSLPSSHRTTSREISIETFDTSSDWATNFQITRASVEEALTESQYCLTQAIPYGALSRFATAVRVNFPFVPPQPASISIAVSGNLDDINTVTTGTGSTATTTTIQQVGADGTPTENNPTVQNPQVTVNLPDIQLDIFGVEIRAEDNTTVVYRQNLTAAGYSIAVSVGNTFSAREATYYVYTYNIFGEYSTAVAATASIPPPTVAMVSVDDLTQVLSWTGISSVGYNIVISDDSAGTVNPITINVLNSTGYNTSAYATNTTYLQNSLFLPTKYITITPYDSIGNGTSMQITHTAPSGSVGLVFRPTTSTDSEDDGGTGNGGTAVAYSLNSAYDTDASTSAIMQVNSGSTTGFISPTVDVSYTGFTSYTTLASATITATISASVNSKTHASILIEATDGTTTYTLFDSSTAGWSSLSTFNVSATIPSGVNINTLSVNVTCAATSTYVSGPTSRVVSANASLYVYDINIQ